MMNNNYVVIRCSRCGKRLLDQRADSTGEVLIYCKHCHKVVPVKLEPQEPQKTKNKTFNKYDTF